MRAAPLAMLLLLAGLALAAGVPAAAAADCYGVKTDGADGRCVGYWTAHSEDFCAGVKRASGQCLGLY